MLALFLGWVGQLAYGITSQTTLAAGFRTFWILWFSGASTFFIGAIIGFLFGIPKTRRLLDDPQATPGYVDNSNLEDVSDWLTKIVVGIGLVEIRQIAEVAVRASRFIAEQLNDSPGAQTMAMASLVYGFACGFLNYYCWARVNLSEEFRRQLREQRGR